MFIVLLAIQHKIFCNFSISLKICIEHFIVWSTVFNNRCTVTCTPALLCILINPPNVVFIKTGTTRNCFFFFTSSVAFHIYTYTRQHNPCKLPVCVMITIVIYNVTGQIAPDVSFVTRLHVTQPDVDAVTQISACKPLCM